MAISIYNLFEAILLVVNAIAVLNEERFLAKSKLYSNNIKTIKSNIQSNQSVGQGISKMSLHMVMVVSKEIRESNQTSSTLSIQYEQ